MEMNPCDFSLLHYSGMDLNDFDPQWFKEHASLFCGTCHNMLPQATQMEIQIIGGIPKNNGMFMLDHALSPFVISENLYRLLPEADQFFLKHTIFSKTKTGMVKQPFFACQAKFEPVVLKGEHPDIFMGKPVPEAERDYICPECGRKDRRERRPWYWYADECPAHPLSATSFGVIIRNAIVQTIDKKWLRAVNVEKIRIKPRPRQSCRSDTRIRQD